MIQRGLCDILTVTRRHDLIQWTRRAAIADGIDLSQTWNVIGCMNVPAELFGGAAGVGCDNRSTEPRWLGQGDATLMALNLRVENTGFCMLAVSSSPSKSTESYY